MTKSLKEIMIVQFRNTFVEILKSQFRSHPKLSPTYLGLSSSRQKSIDDEIVKISRKMSESLVRKLEKKGYLDMEPDEAELNKLIHEVLEEFGVKDE